MKAFITTLLTMFLISLFCIPVFAQRTNYTIQRELPGAYQLHADRFWIWPSPINSMDSGQSLIVAGPFQYRTRILSAMVEVFASGQVDSSGAPNGRFWLYGSPDNDLTTVDSLQLIDSVLVDTGLLVRADFKPNELHRDSAVVGRDHFLHLKWNIDQNYGPDTLIGASGDTTGGVFPGRYGGKHGGKPDTIRIRFELQTVE